MVANIPRIYFALNFFVNAIVISYRCSQLFKSKSTAISLHAMEAHGGEEV
jgi:hypothetical protein